MEAKTPRTRKKNLPPVVLTTYQLLMGKKTAKKPPGVEAKALSAILDYLVIVRKEYAHRNNTIPVYDAEKKIFRKMPKHSEIGGADIRILLRGGYLGQMEVKAPGKKQSPEQVEVMNKTCALGAFYSVVHSIDEAKIALDNWYEQIRQRQLIEKIS